MSIIKSMAGEFSSNRVLMIGVLFLVVSFLLSLLSVSSEHRALSIPAAILAVFGAILAIKGYVLFLRKVKTQRLKLKLA
jgi:hypothetical protein